MNTSNRRLPHASHWVIAAALSLVSVSALGSDYPADLKTTTIVTIRFMPESEVQIPNLARVRGMACSAEKKEKSSSQYTATLRPGEVYNITKSFDSPRRPRGVLPDGSEHDLEGQHEFLIREVEFDCHKHKIYKEIARLSEWSRIYCGRYPQPAACADIPSRIEYHYETYQKCFNDKFSKEWSEITARYQVVKDVRTRSELVLEFNELNLKIKCVSEIKSINQPALDYEGMTQRLRQVGLLIQ